MNDAKPVSSDDKHELTERGSEAWLSTVLSGSGVGVWDLNLGDHTVWRSPEHDRIFGYDELLPEWTYEKFLEHVFPEDRPAVDEAFRTAVARSGVWDFECRIRRADGETRWIAARGRAWSEPAGRPARILGMVGDITDRKRAGQALRASEERYRALFESIDEGFCIIEVIFDDDEQPVDYRFLEVNPSFVGQTGLENPLDRTVREMVPQHDRHWFETYGRVAVTAQPERFTNEAKALGRWYDVYAFRVGEPHERKVAVLFNDITQRKRTEAVEESQRTALEQLARGDSLNEVMKLLIGTIEENSDGRLAGSAALLDETGSQFIASFGPDLPDSYHRAVVGMAVSSRTSSCCRAVLERRAVAVADVRADPEWPRFADAIVPLGFCAAWSVPIVGTGGRILGTFANYGRTPQQPTDRDLAFIDGIARTAALAIERSRAEEVLRDSEERFRTLAQHAPVGIFVTEPDGNCLFVNQAWCEMAGMTVEAARGPGWADALHPEDRARVLEEWYAAAREHRPFAAEYRFKRPDGRVFWLEGSAIELRDAADRLTGYIGTINDITARREAEQATRESEEKFRMIADNMDQLAWTCDELGNATWYNQRWLDYTGLSFEEMCDWGWKRCHHPDHGDRVVESVTRSRDAGEIWEDIFPLRRYDGEYRWFLSRAVPIRNENGDIVRWFGTNTDITEQREADRRKDEFLATLAHELRNPLAPIRNSLQILRMSAGDDAAAKPVFEMMERQVSHMVRLIDDLIEASRITRGLIELRREGIDLAATLRGAVEASKPLIDSNGHQLAVSIPPEPIPLDGDPVRLSQVFTNLLNNAAKYTERGGRIWLTAHRDGAQAVVSVRDTGIGLSPDKLLSVFDMFMQVERSGKGSQGGLGIGLALVKTLVKLHGGTITAHSEGSGRGSEFTVRLPLAAGAAFNRQASRPLDRKQHSMTQRRVLVVDDNVDAAASMELLLKALGSDVQVAHDGPTALAIIRSDPPDVVLLDLGMPLMDGFEVARRIREHPANDDIVLIALTGWGQDEDRARTEAAGFNHHLVKPADMAALQSLLEADET